MGIIKLQISGECRELSLKNEYDLRFLQKLFPPGVVLMGCLTCRHGNVEPGGEINDFIYCLKGCVPKNKSDVVKAIQSGQVETHALMDWCSEYQTIDANHYVYNEVQKDFFPDLSDIEV